MKLESKMNTFQAFLGTQNRIHFINFTWQLKLIQGYFSPRKGWSFLPKKKKKLDKNKPIFKQSF